MEWPLLGALTADERREVLRLARRRRFRRHEVVFHEGDPGDTLHLVERGHATARVTTPLGDVALLSVMGPGDHFGELALVSERPVRSSTVAAVDALETLSIHREEWEALRRAHPGIDRFLVAALAQGVQTMSARLVEALYVPVEKRVLRRLADLAPTFAEGDGRMRIPLTQEDLAGMAGTTRPSANRVLRAAEEAGLVVVGRGRVEIVDLEGLRRRGR